MIRHRTHLAIAFGLASAWLSAPAVAQPSIDTSIRLDPTARDARRMVPRAGSTMLAEPLPEEPAFDLLTIDVPELPSITLTEVSGLTVLAGRSTTFIDGGLGDEGLLADEAIRRHRAPGFHSGDGEFDMYDLSLSRDAWSDGPLTVSLIGGVRTVSVQSVRLAEDAGYTDREHVGGFVPVPVVGTGVRLDLLPGLYVAGAAATHTIPDYATMLDLTAQAGLQLHPNALFQAGYQSVYSSVTVDRLEQQFDQEGFFARLRISF